MDLPDGRRRQGLAGVPLAGAAVAHLPTSSKVDVEPIDQVYPVLKLSYGHVPQSRHDLPLDVTPGGTRGTYLMVGHVEPRLHERGDAGRAVGGRLGFDLVNEPIASDARGAFGVADLGDLDPPTRDGVSASAHHGSKPAAGQRFDVPLRHGEKLTAVRPSVPRAVPRRRGTQTIQRA